MENYTVHIVSCSGASNTGKYSDAVARMLMAGENAKNALPGPVLNWI